PHRGAHPGPPGHLVQRVGDARESHQVLAGGTDLGDSDELVAELGEQDVFDLAGDLAPEVRGGADLDGAFVDPQVDRGGGDAVEDDPVPARTLQLGAPVPAGLRLPEPAGERRLGADAMAARARHRRAGEHAGRDDQNIVGPERVGALGHVLEEGVRDQAAAARVTPEERVAGLLDPGRAVRQIDVQDLVPVSVAVRHAPPSLNEVASPSGAAPPSIGLSSISSAVSCNGVSRDACSPSTATVMSASSAMPIVASRSWTVAWPGTV